MLSLIEKLARYVSLDKVSLDKYLVWIVVWNAIHTLKKYDLKLPITQPLHDVFFTWIVNIVSFHGNIDFRLELPLNMKVVY